MGWDTLEWTAVHADYMAQCLFDCYFHKRPYSIFNHPLFPTQRFTMNFAGN